MRRLLSIITTALLAQASLAQPAALTVSELHLQNGMTVWVNEDHSQPKVYGCVVVRAGAKDCPDTGIAHYFEHIMFKGTDRIGTTDYEAERPWLDSISAQYDLLSQTNATTLQGLTQQAIDSRRAAIQQHINELSLKAADYAIPNEFSRLIAQYGGSGLNAATGPDMTYYYNTFLPQYVAQWCWLNSERLIHPVFRGFQAELENVYEEKNRAADNFGGAFDKVLKAVFKDQPYAAPVLGSTESLKNPRLSDMEAFYKKYYVAPNMCLILCGDITPGDSLTSLLEQTFGRVPTGPVPARVSSPMPPITPGECTAIRLPIPIVSAEALVFNAPTAFDADANAMRIACRLLADGKAGMIDSLVNEHLVMEAGVMSFDDLSDAAAAALYIIPKIPFGSMKKAQARCLAQLRRLMDGDFTQQQVEALKQQYLIDVERAIETIDGRAEKMVDVYARGYSWQQYLDQIEACRQVTKDDVMRVARKYFDATYLTLQKRYGTDTKETLQQPGYLPVKPRNAAAKSAYAEWLAQLPVGTQPVRTVDLARDVERRPLSPHATLYYKQNPVNDIFTLTLRYYNGTRATPLVAQLGEHLTAIGTDSLKKQQLESAFQQMGATMEVGYGDERLTFTLMGRDDRLVPALRLLAHFLAHAEGDDKALRNLKQEAKVNDKAFGKQKDDVLLPMLRYVSLREQSEYLRQPSLSDIKQLTSSRLLSLFRETQQYDCDIIYSGRLSSDSVAAMVQQLPLGQCQHPQAFVHRVLQPVDRGNNAARGGAGEGLVYFYHVPKSRQNYVCSYELLPALSDSMERTTAQLWARYMGGGMSGLLFQHIREFRSLAYSTQGQLMEPNYARYPQDPAAFVTITGTQADKTLQVMEAIDSLLTQPLPLGDKGNLSSLTSHFSPQSDSNENLNAARQELLSDIQSSYPSFRTIGYYVANRLLQGHTSDPNRQQADLLPQVTQADVERFHRQHVMGNRRAWIVIGDRRLTDLQALQRYGQVVELKKEDVWR